MGEEKDQRILINTSAHTERELSINYAELIQKEDEEEQGEIDDFEGQSSEVRDKFAEEPFDPDEWELIDGDECVIELMGILDKEYLHNCDKERIKLIGLFEEDGKACLQLDQMVFTGEPSETFGTSVIFEESVEEVLSSDEDDTYTSVQGDLPKKQRIKMNYVTSTRKKITMYRSMLKQKNK